MQDQPVDATTVTITAKTSRPEHHLHDRLLA
jgi:hypothetical protein